MPVLKFWPVTHSLYVNHDLNILYALLCDALTRTLRTSFVPLPASSGEAVGGRLELEREAKFAPSSLRPAGFLPSCTPPAKILHSFSCFFFPEAAADSSLWFSQQAQNPLDQVAAAQGQKLLESLPWGLGPRLLGLSVQRHQLKLLVPPPQKSESQLHAVPPLCSFQ